MSESNFKQYKKHTNGCHVSNIEVDSSEVFDSVKIQFGFIWNPYKEFIISVNHTIGASDSEDSAGADFANLRDLKERIYKQGCNSFEIRPISRLGMLFVFGYEKILVPMYDYSTGYYHEDVDMKIIYREYNKDGTIKVEEETIYNPSEIYSLIERQS